MSLVKRTEEPRSRMQLPPSLADAGVGDRVRVHRITLEGVESLCDDISVSQGDRVRVERRSRGTVVVRNQEGRPVHIPDYCARHIHVRGA